MTTSEARLVLGLETGFSGLELRDAYRRKAKEFHPDTASDTAMAHLRMIAVNRAYNLLKSEAASRIPGRRPGRPGNGDYELYRSGIDVFERIHPSEWVRVTKAGLFDPSALERRVETRAAIQAAIKRISEAYRIFSDLLDRFPDSIWAGDARDKIKTLDTLILRYDKMTRNSN